MVEGAWLVAAAQILWQRSAVVVQKIVREALGPLTPILAVEMKVQAVAPRLLDEHLVRSEHLMIVAAPLGAVVQSVQGCQVSVRPCAILSLRAIMAVTIAHHRQEIDGRGGLVAGEGVGHVHLPVACQFGVVTMGKLASPLQVVLALLLALAVVLVIGQRHGQFVLPAFVAVLAPQVGVHLAVRCDASARVCRLPLSALAGPSRLVDVVAVAKHREA